MSAPREDEATIADAVAYFMCSTADVRAGTNPWEVVGLDIGEVEITTANGQKFRLTIEEINEEG